MYYPLLRARQFELIALRELALENVTQACVRPILEPVKKSHRNLDLAYQVFKDNNQKAYLIINPQNGELKGDTEQSLNYLKERSDVFLPAFYFSNNSTYIKQAIEENALNDSMLICSSELNEDNPDFVELAESGMISTFVAEDPSRNRPLRSFIKSLDKTFIRLDDLFAKQDRNSDYLGIEEHRFSEEHLYYTEDGYQGFSDYTALPREFVDGGSMPRAVVIHLTYLNQKNEIYIRHFTSTTNDSIANVQGKFGEAVEKAVQYCLENKIENSATKELQDYFDRGHYPGLGMVKKISIKNHILVVGSFLNSQR